MEGDGARCHQQSALLQQGHHLSREGGERRQPSEKSGNHQQAPCDGQVRVMRKPGNGQTNQIAPDEVCEQRAERDGREQCVQAQTCSLLEFLSQSEVEVGEL